MDLSVRRFLALLAGVALLRAAELLVSRANQRALLAQGAAKPADPHFIWMVLVHAGVIIGAAIEVVWLRRQSQPLLAAAAGTLFVAANVVRWWVIYAMGRHWNVQVMDSRALGIVSTGPFRFVRHPNYAAVFVELTALPLVHTAWLTAILGSLGHAWVLSKRIALEDAVLLADAEYRRLMAHKPKFLPL
jgi:methyltransferase